MKVESVAVDSVHVGNRLRAVDRDSVATLASSITEIGLQSPITVRVLPEVVDGDGQVCSDVPVLVAGLHRLEAYRLLGLQQIDAIVLVGDERDARLWEIAENLHRSGLSDDERRKHIAEWVRLTAERVSQRETPSAGGLQPAEKAIRKAAKELGVSKDTVSRAVAAEGLSDDVKHAADEAGLGTVKRAQVAAEPDTEKQLQKVQELKRRVEDRKLVQGLGDQAVQRDASDDAAQMLIDFIPESRMQQLLSYLDGAGATRVTKAVRRALKVDERVGSDRAVFDQTMAGAA